MPDINQTAQDLVKILEGGLLHEDFMDSITNVDDQEFILMPRAGTGSTDNPEFSWAMDRYKLPDKTNAAVQGQDVDQRDNSEGQRVFNHVQTSIKEVQVGTQADASNAVDRANTLSFQIGKVGVELKRDQEAILFGNQTAQVADDNTDTPGLLGGLESWIDGKTLIPAEGGATTYNQTEARLDISTGGITGGGWDNRAGGSNLIPAWDYTGSTPNALTETNIKDVVKALFKNTGSRADRSMVMDVDTNSQVADFYFTSSARVATLTAETNQEGPARAMGAINSILTNYGIVHLVPSNLKGFPDDVAEASGSSSAMILDWSQISVVNQRGMISEPLAKTGLSRKMLLSVMYSLRVKSSEALGIIQGIDASTPMLP